MEVHTKLLACHLQDVRLSYSMARSKVLYVCVLVEEVEVEILCILICITYTYVYVLGSGQSVRSDCGTFVSNALLSSCNNVSRLCTCNFSIYPASPYNDYINRKNRIG